jgi:hypothetical protein
MQAEKKSVVPVVGASGSSGAGKNDEGADKLNEEELTPNVGPQLRSISCETDSYSAIFRDPFQGDQQAARDESS